MRSFSPARHGQRGFTLVELLVALAVVGLVMAAVVTLYVTGSRIYTAGTGRADAQQAARAAMVMLAEDLRLAGSGYPTVSGLPKITAATATSITFWGDLTNGSTILSQDVNAGDTALAVDSAAGVKPGDTIYLINGGAYEALAVSSAGGTSIAVGAGTTASYPQFTQVGLPKAITYSWNAATRTLSKDAGDGVGAQLLADGVQAFQLLYFDTGDAAIPEASLAANLENIRRITITMTGEAPGQNPPVFTITSDVRPRNL
ncbi:MAG: PilW family protein [Anaerolineae bacterium]